MEWKGRNRRWLGLCPSVGRVYHMRAWRQGVVVTARVSKGNSTITTPLVYTQTGTLLSARKAIKIYYKSGDMPEHNEGHADFVEAQVTPMVLVEEIENIHVAAGGRHKMNQGHRSILNA
jgi:hypothetical protein